MDAYQEEAAEVGSGVFLWAGSGESYHQIGTAINANKEEAERYSQARKWVLEKKLPRFVFVKFSGEFKPVFIDFTSPVYIEIFSKLVRRAVSDQGQADASFTLTEMLPGIEDCWLPDAANKRYTCELRMVAVEQLSQKKCGGQWCHQNTDLLD